MSMPAYSPDLCIIRAFGSRIIGFADGTFVKIAMATEAVSTHVGADGRATMVVNLDKTGEITLTLSQESPSNDVLSRAYQNRRNVLGRRPFLLQDLSGTTQVSVGNCWVKKMPEPEFGKEQSNREWVLGGDSIEMFVGGITPS